MSPLAQSIIAALIRPFARVTKNFVPQDTWNTMEVGPGLAWTNDPVNQLGIFSIDMADPLTLPSPLGIGPGLATYSFAPVQAAISSVVIATLPFPVNVDSTLYLWVKASIMLGSTMIATYNAKFVTGVVNAGGSIFEYWPSGSSIVASETNTNQPFPWAGFFGNVNVAVTGAVSSAGKIKATLASTNGLSAGMTGAVAGTTGVPTLNQSWIVDSVVDATHIILRNSTFSGTFGTSGTFTPQGAYNFVGSTDSLILVGTGFVPAPWNPSEAVVNNGVFGCDFRQNAGNIYYCVTSGTTASSGPGPTSASNGVSDGSAVWNYYGPAALGVIINWSVPRMDIVS